MVRFWSHYTEYGSTPGCNHDDSFDHDPLLKRKLILFPTIEHKRTKLKVLIEITNQIQNAMRNLMVLYHHVHVATHTKTKLRINI